MAGGEDGSPSWLGATSEVQVDQTPIQTDDWFDSNLVPAAEQPEAQNLRASDSDPVSLEAQLHTGTASSGGVAGSGQPDPTQDPAPGYLQQPAPGYEPPPSPQPRPDGDAD
jgi:hypothetical protein